ncbi:Membrane protein related to metalloendopeptidase [Hahella chejuensis KCTC 2396]|uniref:Membrane protein related to metalloendopeptidase n=1 Tax=Hahella chejuensis (strain KCTC 2396) TaxID=349521 RepID=Q2S706_HAHCH|nr:M23 family metallopeptidase [Hahella chejuensis]ABC33568.1 Membrane protein related to metalloendopeptidase [Hahella chejuensis KCTC 2396]
MKKKRALLILLGIIIVWTVAPESPTIPVQGATSKDWNANTFWYEPWGKSGVHKGIDIFADAGTPVVSPTYGVVVFRGELGLGGKVVAVLGPKWRIHYFAHLKDHSVYPGYLVRTGTPLGTVGDTGNAKGKPPHLHYSAVTLLPYPWRADDATQGWKKMFFLDPNEVLGVK